MKNKAEKSLSKLKVFSDITLFMNENNEEIGDPIAENSLDAIVHFNDDMKILGMNAF